MIKMYFTFLTDTNTSEVVNPNSTQAPEVTPLIAFPGEMFLHTEKTDLVILDTIANIHINIESRAFDFLLNKKSTKI